MKVLRLAEDINKKTFLKSLNCDNGGINIMSLKMQNYYFLIKKLNVVGANILKQEALSLGADLACPKTCITHQEKEVDLILIIDKRRLKKLIIKLKTQAFKLKELALYLEEFLEEKVFKPEVMGVLNINKDSFYKNSRVGFKKFLKKVNKLLKDGANIIDIGAVSSRPGSLYIGEKEEFSRAKIFIDKLYKEKIYEKTSLSLDSYSPLLINYALDKGFKIINDITGLENDEVAKIIAKYKAKLIIMHMQNKPFNMQDNPYYEDIIYDISEFFKQRIQKAHSFGIKNIIIDPGIGFGKKLNHNLKIISNLRHFKKFSLPILIGASRKSMINDIKKTKVKDRLAGSLAIHLKAYENGANILRTHDVKEHIQAISLLKAIKEVPI